ncbi:ethylene-responsive transcription factor ERF053-like [Aegilops tauschii subsp. strangulata]|uniref:ethylene-responsive transcription factor ERF053-like n=1 Tax=Aegilops tauschii subsp. strangulata TaxID=200361 RepID=UPI00098A2C7C|nr:ethylene-responsive transcription factor 5-like [Aegilops tauschii subsp. strangulata]
MSMRRLGAADFRRVRERRSGVFSSEISFGEKRLSLGTFDTAEEAARAYDAAAWRLRRPRWDMNFPDVSMSQRAQDLAHLPRLFTDEDRRDNRRRQRRLAIAEMDVEARSGANASRRTSSTSAICYGELSMYHFQLAGGVGEEGGKRGVR